MKNKKYIVSIYDTGEAEIVPFTNEIDYFTLYTKAKTENATIKNVILGSISDKFELLAECKDSGLSAQALIHEGAYGALLELKAALDSWGVSLDEPV